MLSVQIANVENVLVFGNIFVIYCFYPLLSLTEQLRYLFYAFKPVKVV